jgi:UDP-N-acetylmuramate--alanine ligase
MLDALNISNIRSVFFIGIGGIGMSALARYFHSKGMKVGGYDRASTELTEALRTEGISIVYEDDPLLVMDDADLIVYTPAIPATSRMRQHYLTQGKRLYKRSEVLGMISASTFNICIAGTHGKTTTSCMVAHILRDSGHGCNAFLGGIASNYGTNFWSHERSVAVIEADEYDRSFLTLHPDIISISSMDPDHLDIYGTAEEMEQAFIQFSERLKTDGWLITRKGLKREGDFNAEHHLTYHAEDASATVHARHLRVEEGVFIYDAVGPDWEISDLRLSMGGIHNVENSLVAITVARLMGIPDNLIKQAIASFKGVKRRFEYIVQNQQGTYIDDYAHHPEELRVLIQGARTMFGGEAITLVFQPHLYSRTRDLADDFAEVLDGADRVILLPIYPARELPIEGVSSSTIADRMKNKPELMDQETLLKQLQHQLPHVLITAGAGDIDKLIEPIKETYHHRA